MNKINKRKRVYLDYGATTPIDSRVVASMLPYFDQDFGNPSSIHAYGQSAEGAVQNARDIICGGLNCQQEEVIFTSCGTESDNLALRGVALAERKRRNANHILISPTEHPAVQNTAKQLASIFGFEIEYLPIDEYGKVKLEKIRDLLRKETALISVIYANNEIGTINPIQDIGEICKELDIPFHTDAVQATTYLTLDVKDLNVDLLSLGAHKFYGPKGVGALYKRNNLQIVPIQTGGQHEFDLRAGTHNVPYIVGMGEAFKIAQIERLTRIAHIKPLRDFLINSILNSVPNSKLTGHPVDRMPNHASFVFENVDGNELLMLLDVEGYACSSGSACRSGDPKPSEILKSLSLDDNWALGSLRVTLGTATTRNQIEKFCETLPKILHRIRKNN